MRRGQNEEPASGPVLGPSIVVPAESVDVVEVTPTKESTMRVNPKLLPVKLLVFLVHGGIAALFPFFTLHMKSIGISITEMAWMLLLLPIISSIGPPLGGALADRLGNYKLVLIIFSILSVILHLLLWFAVPAFGMHRLNVPVEINSGEFLVTFSCSDRRLPPILTLQTPRGRFVEGCNLTDDWKSPQLTDCRQDPECPTEYEDLKICFSSGSQQRGGISAIVCYHWPEIEDFFVTGIVAPPGGNGTSSPIRDRPLNDTTTRSYWTALTLNAAGLESPKGAVGSASSLRNPYCSSDGRASCSISCTARSDNNLACHETATVAFGDRLTTLALYFTLRFLSFTAIRVVFPLLDAAVVEIAREHKGDFGIQRLFASVGFVVIPPLSGYLIGVATRRNANHTSDYSPAFYIFATMNIMAVVLMIFMKFGARSKQANIWSSMGTALRNPNALAFTFAILICGAAFGFLVNFLFLFMEMDVGYYGFAYKAPKYLLGLTSAVGYLLGIPLLFFSTPLIRRFGLENILAFVLLCYAGRFIAYSFTFDPFLVLPIEILTAITGMVLVLMPQFAVKTAPKYLATLTGLFGAVNFGLGGGIGPLVGGLLIASFGYRITFQIFGIFCAGAAALYFLLYHLFLKKRAAGVLQPDEKTERVPTIDPEESKPLQSSLSPPIFVRTKSASASDVRAAF